MSLETIIKTNHSHPSFFSNDLDQPPEDFYLALLTLKRRSQIIFRFPGQTECSWACPSESVERYDSWSGGGSFHCYIHILYYCCGADSQITLDISWYLSFRYCLWKTARNFPSYLHILYYVKYENNAGHFWQVLKIWLWCRIHCGPWFLAIIDCLSYLAIACPR